MECGERRVEDRLFGNVHIYREDGGRKKKKPESECSGRMDKNSEGMPFEKLEEGGIARSR